MIDKTLEEIVSKLNENGFSFTLCDLRHAESLDGDSEYASYCGILRDETQGELVLEQLLRRVDILLTPMEKLGVYLTVHPEVKTLRQDYSSSKVLPIGPNELMVCFIQAGVIQTFEEASSAVLESLKQSFLYVQEDEGVLVAVKLLTLMGFAFAPFRRWYSRDPERMVRDSRLLRVFLERESENMVFLGDAAGYMESAANKECLEKLCSAICCIEMVCRGV